jgi:sugar phosphate isomerase/epimerase
MSEPMPRVLRRKHSISQLTTYRWDLPIELEHLAYHGFDAIALWRTKLSDVGVDAARKHLDRTGIRVSSLQWAGGFTGSDGRTFRESIDDAAEAILTAERVGAEVLVLHTGCRGGHTLGHARRLLTESLDILAPLATDRGVTLAIEPHHPAAAVGCGFMPRLAQALEWVDRFDHPAVQLVLDLWQFGHEPSLGGILPDLVKRLALVKVADRIGMPSSDRERLPPGEGHLPLERLVADLQAAGFSGDLEFEVVGEAVEAAGYDTVLRRLREVTEGWTEPMRRPLPRQIVRVTSVARRSSASVRGGGGASAGRG